MGYRFHLDSISKDELALMQSCKDIEELQQKVPQLFEPDDDDDDPTKLNCCWHNYPSKYLYDLGPLYHFDQPGPMFNACIPIFKDEIVKADYSFNDYDLHIFTKEAFEIMIRKYQQVNSDYFKNLSENRMSYTRDSKQNISNNLLRYELKGIASDIKASWFIDFDKKGSVTGSDRYIFTIFNLMYIYKTFDWDNNVIVMSGW